VDEFEKVVRIKPVLRHQPAQRRAVAAVIILLDPERLLRADLEIIADEIPDARVDLLPEVQVMRVERVVEIEHPGVDPSEAACCVRRGRSNRHLRSPALASATNVVMKTVLRTRRIRASPLPLAGEVAIAERWREGTPSPSLPRTRGRGAYATPRRQMQGAGSRRRLIDGSACRPRDRSAAPAARHAGPGRRESPRRRPLAPARRSRFRPWGSCRPQWFRPRSAAA